MIMIEMTTDYLFCISGGGRSVSVVSVVRWPGAREQRPVARKISGESVERIEEICEKGLGKNRSRTRIDGDGNAQHQRRNRIKFELLAQHSPQQKRPVFAEVVLQFAHCLSGLALVG